jgi:PiT family inorganic phosphate transporter
MRALLLNALTIHVMVYSSLIGTIISLYLAWSIGSNDETVAPLVGSGVIDIKKSVILGGLAAFLGAILLGNRVEITLGDGLLLGFITDIEILVILLSVATWLTLASFLGWPVSTTHSTVGAIIGLGLVKWGIQGVQWSTLTIVTISWVLSPFLGFLCSMIIYQVIVYINKNRVKGLVDQMIFARYSAFILTIWVLIISFSRGANDIGNATAFLGDISNFNHDILRFLIAFGMFLGLVISGRKVIQSVGIDLVQLDPISSLSSQIAVALLMLSGTYFGLPLSGTHILVGAVVGQGISKGIWINVRGIREISYMWFATFFASAFFSMSCYILVSFL